MNIYYEEYLTRCSNKRLRLYGSVITLIFILIFSTSLMGLLNSNADAQNLNSGYTNCVEDSLTRFGINVHRDTDRSKNLHTYDYESIGFGWYTDYYHEKPTLSPDEVAYFHMVKPKWVPINQIAERLESQVAGNLGATWIVGNEPDNAGQDGFYLSSAGEYATYYHHVYTYIKELDPSAKITIAGVVQPSVLRLQYLDQVLAEYQVQFSSQLPMDLMNVHNFVMSERSIPGEDIVLWGNGAPPGMDADNPNVRYIAPEQHWNIDIFKQQIYDVRTWMQDNEYDMPLIVSEYGILLPDEWDLNQIGTANFMTQSFDFFLSERDEELGYEADDYRLVQAFGWFSLNYPPYATSEGEGLNGALFGLEDREITSLGEAYRDYVQNYIVECNSEPSATLESTTTVTPLSNSTITVTVTLSESPMPRVTPTALSATQTPVDTTQTPNVTPTPIQTSAVGSGSGDIEHYLYIPYR